MITKPDSDSPPGVQVVVHVNLDAEGHAADVTTCPRCRTAVLLGQACACPMRWTGGSERPK